MNRSSTSGDVSISWVLISRGTNRFVEELQFYDPDYSPESRELANHTSVGKPHAMLASTEETRASQQRTQSNLMNNHSKNFIPLGERKWNDILAYDVNGRTLEFRVSKLVL